jgi:multiple sugar transport system permease protein
MKMMRPPRWGLLLLLATALLFSIPLVWMLLSSLKPAGQLTEDPYSLLPRTWQWSNFSEALDSMPYLVYLANSLLL